MGNETAIICGCSDRLPNDQENKSISSRDILRMRLKARNSDHNPLEDHEICNGSSLLIPMSSEKDLNFPSTHRKLLKIDTVIEEAVLDEKDIENFKQRYRIENGIQFSTDLEEGNEKSEFNLSSFRSRSQYFHGLDLSKLRKTKEGSIFLGASSSGVKSGECKELFPSGVYFSGMYSQGLRNGYGILSLSSGERFKGYFKNNAFEGFGMYFWKKGKKYVGDWRNGLRDGKGIMEYANGDRYEGYFINNKKHGKGELHYAHGECIKGEWKNDLLDGICYLRKSDGTEYEVWYNAGNKQKIYLVSN